MKKDRHWETSRSLQCAAIHTPDETRREAFLLREGEKLGAGTFSLRHNWGSCIGISDDSQRTTKHHWLENVLKISTSKRVSNLENFVKQDILASHDKERRLTRRRHLDLKTGIC